MREKSTRGLSPGLTREKRTSLILHRDLHPHLVGRLVKFFAYSSSLAGTQPVATCRLDSRDFPFQGKCHVTVTSRRIAVELTGAVQPPFNSPLWLAGKSPYAGSGSKRAAK
jgi:hypothetical protein